MNREKYTEIVPPEHLNDFIKFFWHYRHDEEDFEYIVLPDACFDLVVDYENGCLQDIYLTGVWTRPKKVIVTKGTDLFAVRFKITAAEIFFSINLKDILDTMIFLPKDFWDIEKKAGNEFGNFYSILSDHLSSILHKSESIDKMKLKLFNLIYNENIYRVDELAKHISWTPRRINRYFNVRFGIPLKQFINMVRCFDSFEEIVNGNLYPSGNHADQAHFIKEIKKYTHMTPRELYKNQNDRFIQLIPLKKR